MKKTANPERTALLREPNFRWMLGGGFISMLGDQFTLIALPWLVLKLTGDPLAMGVVLALMGVPRAVFILIGGALVDRYSPKRVMMLTKYASAIFLGILAAMVLLNVVSMPLIFAIGLGIGLAQAFGLPSGSSMMPTIVVPEQLQAANGVLMGMRQLVTLLGPLLAGALIAFGGATGHEGALSDSRGIGLAFAFDCFSFVFSSWTLAKVQPRASTQAAEHKPVFAAVAEGISTVWQDRGLRTTFAYWAVIMFCIGGSFQVAMPVLADTRLHGASSLGFILGAHAFGTLAGMAISSVKGGLRIGNLGTTILVIDAIAGVLLMPLGYVSTAWQAAALLLVLGTLAGFMQVAIFSWIQSRVPRAMLGRAMSIFMFIFMGIAPISAAVTGWLMHSFSVAQLFNGAGLFMVAVALLAFALTPMRTIAEQT